MKRHKKEIKAVIVMPENKNTLRQFEKKLNDFYITQVEKRIQHLPKEQKLEVIDALLATTYQ